MKPFIYNGWHAWEGTEFMLSDERTKNLKSFKTPDDLVTYLYTQDREAARALNRHIKDNT